MASLCVCSTHTHPDADIREAAFDTTRFQHIWRTNYRSFDLLSSLNEQERFLATSNNSFEPIRNSCPVVQSILSSLISILHSPFALREDNQITEKVSSASDREY